MDDTNELKSIVEALVSKTASGKLSWKLSRRDNIRELNMPVEVDFGSRKTDLGDTLTYNDAYYVSLGSGFVTMTKKSPEYDPDQLALTFFDKKGNKAAEYRIEAGETHWDELNVMIDDIHKKLFGFKTLINELVG